MRRSVAVVVLAVVLALALAASVWAFSDVSSDHPYSAAIADLSSRQVISGFQDGTFKPDAPVTRQQFAKMVVLALELPCSEADTCSFSDVEMGGAGTLYPDNYIAVCAANQITLGTSPGHFSPAADISRAQLVTMVVRATNRLHPGTLDDPPANYPGTLGNFSDTHGSTMRQAEYGGLLSGLLGFGASWDPWASASRGEVAQILHNLLGKLQPPSGQSPLEVAAAHPDAAGDDNQNLNDEWIQFRVLVSGSLVGYSVEDATGHHYDFPDRVFQAEQLFKLHTGAGTDTQTDLYWNSGSAIWNNDGDTVKLLDPEGYVLLSESIGTPSATTTTTYLTTTTTSGTTTTTVSTTTTTSGGVTVYITATGNKYHRAGCRYLKDSSIPIPLSQAKAEGYQPCSVCKPPT